MPQVAASETIPAGLATDNTMTRRNLVVERVEAGSAAAKAGLQKDDVLVSVGDFPVACSLDLERAFLDQTAAKPVSLTLRRGGSERRVELALRPTSPLANDSIWRRIGLRMEGISPDQIHGNHPQLKGGMLVVEVDPAGAATKAGIQPGDVLVGLHQWETVTLDNVSFVLNHPGLATFSPLRFYILRAGQVHRGTLPVLD
jgi:serine protease Do